MSSAGTPGYPAPLTACMVLTKTFCTSNLRCNGESANTNPIAEQLGLVTANPPLSLNHFWVLSRGKWSPLTSGMTSGTSSIMRKPLELLITACPAAANLGSISLAAAESSAAKMTLGAPSGDEAANTIMLAILFGSGVLSRHLAASAYGFPAERSEAASHATSNHGWSSSSWIKRCPTVPVAPRIPTGILAVIINFDFNRATQSGM